jgi:mono/diheme cytochrome c family protein
MKLASRCFALVAGCVLLAAGCDDEVVNAGDGGPTDGGAADVATGETAPPPAPDAAVVSLTQQQARGKYLVDHVVACPDCHTPTDEMFRPLPGKYLSGMKCFIKLPNGDCLHTPNLTNDATGLKNRTDAEIKDMFLNGKRPAATSGGAGDGGAAEVTALNPFMPYYVFHNMDADDADAIVAYLRTVPAVENSPGRRSASFDVPAPAAYIDPANIPMPSPGYASMESALRGRYLTSKIGLCVECHTQHNPPGSPSVLMAGKYFQGGERFDFGFPVVPVSKNLTSDMATGLGNWKVEDIVKVLKEGKDKDGKGICPPMPVGPMGAYGGLSYQDSLDIANYIKSLPAASNMINDTCTFPPKPQDGGAGDGGATDAAATEGGLPLDANILDLGLGG